ncbi:hypothetical protein ACFE04_015326 [Oxalis oulophora]
MSNDGFAPFISAHLHYLFNHFPHTIKIDQASSGNKYNPALLDRFTLLIPYCLDFIKWDIIYNAESPNAAPDVIFGPDDQDFHPFQLTDANTTTSSLSDWTNKDHTRLFSLIKELRDQYAAYQCKRVGEVDDARLKFEVSTMVPREGIEMHLCSGIDKSEEVKFAVPLLDKNINKMVIGCPWRYPQKIHLQVVYPVTRKYVPVPSAPRVKLIATPELKALFSVDDVKLPSWLDGMCMAEYLPNLEESLERQLLDSVSLIELRRHFIEALAPLFGKPLEADSVFCRKATFLSMSGVFVFLVHFFIPAQFPKIAPAIMLQSTQHFIAQGVPMKSPLMTDYPWSPRWEVSLMAERIW